MRKSVLLVAGFLLTVGVSFAQTTDQKVTVETVKIETSHLEPIQYLSQEELEKSTTPRIEVIKEKLSAPNLSMEEIISYKELLWRFENAVVIEKKTKSTI